MRWIAWDDSLRSACPPERTISPISGWQLDWHPHWVSLPVLMTVTNRVVRLRAPHLGAGLCRAPATYAVASVS